MTNENMNAVNRYAAALVELKAGRHTYAMSNLRSALECHSDPETRVQILTTAAEVALVRCNQVSNTAAYLLEVQALLDANGELPAIHRANVGTLTAQMHMRNGEYERAADSVREAIFTYRVEGDESKAVNGELLLAACLLAKGEAGEALGVCRKIRRNPARDPRLFELNVLQAKVCDALGEEDEKRRLVRNAVEVLRSRLGESDFRTVAELATLTDVDLPWMLNDAAYADTNPFPTSAPVVEAV